MKKNQLSDYVKGLYEATRGLKGAALAGVIKNFVELLTRKQLLKKVDLIIAEFVAYAKRQEGIVGIEVTSARELDDKTINQIKKIFGSKVEAVAQVSAGLLGGLTVRTADTIFDASLKTQLFKLKQALV